MNGKILKCLACGSEEHLIRECPKKDEYNRIRQSFPAEMTTGPEAQTPLLRPAYPATPAAGSAYKPPGYHFMLTDLSDSAPATRATEVDSITEQYQLDWSGFVMPGLPDAGITSPGPSARVQPRY